MPTQHTIREPFTERQIVEDALKFEIMTLKRERDDARDAAAHFFHCIECGDGEYCFAGRQFAILLKLKTDEGTIEI